MILDATAGNRKFWRNSPENVVYIDIQKKLEKKPTMFADNRNLPFKECCFDSIIFDPPHSYGDSGSVYCFPDAETYNKTFPNYPKKIPTYYGMDFYKSKTSLMSAIFKAQKEFLRVLKNDGMFWLNWSELKISVDRVLTLFSNDWTEHIRLKISSNQQTLSDISNWWVCLMKNNSKTKQASLTVGGKQT